MAGLQTARERLDAAVTRLEGAMEGYSARLRQRLSTLEGRAAQAEDVTELMESLEAAQRDNERLVSANDVAAERIDRVAGRLRALLGPDLEDDTGTDAGPATGSASAFGGDGGTGP